MRTRLTGGALSLADAGTASVATFVASLVALRSLDDPELALYALVFAALTALMIAPQYMLYIPQRLHANRQPQVRRTSYRADARGAVPYAAVTAVGVFLAALPLRGGLSDPSAYVAICATAAVLSALSPFQDHMRASLHVAGRHGRAALVSAVNLGVVSVIFVAVEWGPQGPAWFAYAAPFGSLVLGNLVSIVAGYGLHRAVTVVEHRDPILFRTSLLAASTGFARQGVAYVANLLVAAMISASALAALETARVAAQPVLILGIGVASFFMPEAVRAIGAGDRHRAGAIMRRLVAVVSGAGAVYALALIPLAPLLALVLGRPVDAGLASARAGSFALSSAANPFNAYNMAERRYGVALGLTAASEIPALVVLVALIPSLGVFAVPVSASVSAVLRIALNVIYRNRADRRAAAHTPAEAAA
ncbi:hypothetical protein [Demequina sp.]|uniref:hypothetical protein n=1 Tax=Demequina sp. TaxID=2050685 RepID=UPI0025CB7B9B|nr:hypothetical protein [Demequina sp.]